ncbi:hypothetical protein CEXT_446751 [Caerostris extrusa]|uniref:Uncharacterized protein n=1 Tax=Caerostris extrusa TaxID=172846 RepID=A0AAV4RHQ2_CAEEX|nr:hypothetical protein CEXT_446751 [Caerostris extrusa]
MYEFKARPQEHCYAPSRSWRQVGPDLKPRLAKKFCKNQISKGLIITSIYLARRIRTHCDLQAMAGYHFEFDNVKARFQFTDISTMEKSGTPPGSAQIQPQARHHADRVSQSPSAEPHSSFKHLWLIAGTT